MHARFALVIIAVATPFVLLLIDPGRCADSSASPPSPTVEKRLVELESKLSAFTKEVDLLHRDDVFQAMMTHSISAKDAANAISAVFRDPLRVQVTALPGPNILIMRGDRKTIERISEFIQMIEPLGEAKQKAQDAKDVRQKKANQ